MEKCSHPNVKYDWYQTETYVVINVLVKQVKTENVRIDIVDSLLQCTAALADGSKFFLNLNLAHAVQLNQISWKVLPVKIEIKLKKTEALMWKNLEDDNKCEAASEAKLYPSSKPEKKDWDKIAFELKKEEENEKLEGDAALNQLFKKIYADGSDETRKAMNKSFMESGGTVLSTSWNEVGAKKIDVKPADGVEWKSWDS